MTRMYALLMRWVQRPWFYWFGRTVWAIVARTIFGLRVDGADLVPKAGGLVIAVNHFSTLDPPMMGVSIPREVSFMAKKELFENRAAALLWRGLHAFPVDRSKSDLSAIKEAKRRLDEGRAIGIFIQGTRNEGDAEALDGAAFLAQRAGVPLQPAALWRVGRGYRVRFGTPFDVEGRGREAIGDATRKAMEEIRSLQPARIESGVSS